MRLSAYTEIVLNWAQFLSGREIKTEKKTHSYSPLFANFVSLSHSVRYAINETVCVWTCMTFGQFEQPYSIRESKIASMHPRMEIISRVLQIKWDITIYVWFSSDFIQHENSVKTGKLYSPTAISRIPPERNHEQMNDLIYAICLAFIHVESSSAQCQW